MHWPASCLCKVPSLVAPSVPLQLAALVAAFTEPQRPARPVPDNPLMVGLSRSPHHLYKYVQLQYCSNTHAQNSAESCNPAPRAVRKQTLGFVYVIPSSNDIFLTQCHCPGTPLVLERPSKMHQKPLTSSLPYQNTFTPAAPLAMTLGRPCRSPRSPSLRSQLIPLFPSVSPRRCWPPNFGRRRAP